MHELRGAESKVQVILVYAANTDTVNSSAAWWREKPYPVPTFVRDSTASPADKSSHRLMPDMEAASQPQEDEALARPPTKEPWGSCSC